jgi:hypothetical protein
MVSGELTVVRDDSFTASSTVFRYVDGNIGRDFGLWDDGNLIVDAPRPMVTSLRSVSRATPTMGSALSSPRLVRLLMLPVLSHAHS